MKNEADFREEKDSLNSWGGQKAFEGKWEIAFFFLTYCL